jgi:hypothetical protein
MIKNFNFKNNQRLDISHLKMIESSVTNDLHALTGNVINGSSPSIVKGFTISVAGAVGSPATSLQMITADSILIHPLGSEEGSLFTVPSTQPAERLNTNNSKVIGSFTPGTTNYIGIDLIRVTDTSTSDNVSILSDTTNKEYIQSVPLGKVLDYRIYIQTANFDSTSNICPIAIVVVNALGGVTSVTDARPLAFRLGVGGTSPSAATPYYSLPDRTEAPVSYTGTGSSPFTGGDKNITSLRDWMAVVERRIWEGNGGSYWYSPSSVNDVRPAYNPDTVFSETLKNWYLDGTDLLWQGLRFIFSNGINDAYYCTVADQTTALAGLTNLSNGECLYIDIDRTQNATNLTVHKDSFAAMPQPTIPGSRLIIAWRIFNKFYVYGQSIPVNSVLIGHASTTLFGTVEVYSLDEGLEPICPTVDLEGKVIASGICNPGPAVQALDIGTTSNETGVNIGRSGVTTTILGMLRSATITGGNTSGADLTLMSTTNNEKGSIFLGGDNPGAIAVFDETNNTLQVNGTVAATKTMIGDLTLLSTSGATKGHINLGGSGLSYFDEENNALQVPWLTPTLGTGTNLTLSAASDIITYRDFRFDNYPTAMRVVHIPEIEEYCFITGFVGVTLQRDEFGDVTGTVTLPDGVNEIYDGGGWPISMCLVSSDPTNFPSGIKEMQINGNSFVYYEDGSEIGPTFYPLSTLSYNASYSDDVPVNVLDSGVTVGDSVILTVQDYEEQYTITETVTEVGKTWFRVYNTLGGLAELQPIMTQAQAPLFYYTQQINKGYIFWGSGGESWVDEQASVFQVPTIRGSSSSGGTLTLTSTSDATKGIISLGTAGTSFINEVTGGIEIGSPTYTGTKLLAVNGNIKAEGDVETSLLVIDGDLTNTNIAANSRLKTGASGLITTVHNPLLGYLPISIQMTNAGEDYTIFNFSLTSNSDTVGTWVVDASIYISGNNGENTMTHVIKIKDETGKIYHTAYFKRYLSESMTCRVSAALEITSAEVDNLIITCNSDYAGDTVIASVDPLYPSEPSAKLTYATAFQV